MSSDKKNLIINELNKRNHFDLEKISVAFPYFDHNEIINALDSLLDLKISILKKKNLRILFLSIYQCLTQQQ